MAYLDVFPNPSAARAPGIPYLLEVQAELFRELPTTVVIPLGLPNVIETRPVLRLNPTLQFKNRRYVLLTQELAAILRRHLKAPVGNLGSLRTEIVGAVDLLLTGF